MTDLILVVVIVAIVGGSIAYIRKEKKRGVRCIGCPSGGTCDGSCGGHKDAGEPRNNSEVENTL